MMKEDKPYSAIFTKEGTVIGVGENLYSAELAAVKRMNNGFSIQELYKMGCYFKSISEKDYNRIVFKKDCDLKLFM